MDFTFLCAALNITGLAEILNDLEEEYTVFAPTNAAFEKLGDAAVDFLMQPENNDLLADILGFHVVSDVALYSSDLSCTERITMANGKDSRSVCRGEKFYQKGKGNLPRHRPEVIEVDFETCNGVIHIVNEIMLFDFPEELGIPARNVSFAPIEEKDSTLSPSDSPKPVRIPTETPPCQNIGKY